MAPPFLMCPVSAVDRSINAIIGGREFASREKHSAPVDAGARGPFTITAVFLIAPGSHPARKRPQRQQKPISEIRFLSRLRHLHGRVFQALAHMSASRSHSRTAAETGERRSWHAGIGRRRGLQGIWCEAS